MNYKLQIVAQWTCKDNIGPLSNAISNNWGDHIKASGSGYKRGQSKLHTLMNKVHEQFMNKDMFQYML